MFRSPSAARRLCLVLLLLVLAALCVPTAQSSAATPGSSRPVAPGTPHLSRLAPSGVLLLGG
jgi:hypothetical protein